MAKVGKTNAGTVKEGVPSLKSRGLKNPSPAAYTLDPNHPDMAQDNDAPGKAGKAPESGKKAPGEMPGSKP